MDANHSTLPTLAPRYVLYPLQTLFVRWLLYEDGASKFLQRLVPWLWTIAVAVLVGFLTWLSMVANFSSPSCRYYRTQVRRDGLLHLCLLLLVLVVVLIRCWVAGAGAVLPCCN